MIDVLGQIIKLNTVIIAEGLLIKILTRSHELKLSTGSLSIDISASKKLLFLKVKFILTILTDL